MRRQEMVEWKAEAGDAGQNSHDEENRSPASHPIPREHAENRNETGGNRDQADDDVNDRISRQTKTEHHHALPHTDMKPSGESTTSERAPSHARAAFGHAPMTEC